jgi:sulfonate transport system permease protein
MSARSPSRLYGTLPWLVPIVVLAGWQAGSDLGWIDVAVLPSPTAVAHAGWQSLRSGELARNVAISTWRAAVGFPIGGGIGFVLGLLNGLSDLAEKLTDSTLQMVRNIPHLALIPLVILWFGIGEEAKIFLVALGVFFPIYVNTLHGVRSVDPHLIEMGRAYGMSRGTLIRRVVLPGALPSIFVGLRYGLGITWLTLIVAETIAASSGIGYMAMNARSSCWSTSWCSPS